MKYRKIYINLIISIVVIFSSVALGVIPLINLTKAKSKDFRNEQQQLRFLKVKSEYRKDLEKDYKKSEEGIKKINSMLINEERVIEFVKELEDIARLTKNQEEIQILNKTDEKAMFFKISLMGDFPSFFHFLVYLENMDYLIEVQNLRIRRLSEKDLIKKELSGFKIGDIESEIEIKVFKNI
ncbi:hypothetical protein J7J12_03275 [bacterium]|nr:hypothetical protein [bacterium]